jgi:class 3 adenylate cyclase/tetratricopeptide (TPR) repeat protein
MLTCPKCGFSNPETAKFCSNCGNPLEQARAIEGERKFATILFADVARSTSIAEQLDPEDWAVVMNGAFGFMNAAVSKYGGTVSRLMGDAVLALFGAPVAHEDDAERAVRAGLEIQDAAMEYAKAVKQKHGFDFDLRVGINTGTAVLAFVGDAVKTEYTAMGDAANVAARLQSAAEPGTVLISADTHRLVHSLFDFKPRGAIEMKGKSAPVDSYEVIGVRAVPGKARGLEGLESAMVGRDKDIGLLRDRYAALKDGRGAAVAIIGEAGLGKSRLVAELRKLHDAAPQEVNWLEARGISFGMSIPYYPWRALGRQLIGASEMDAAPVVREKIAAFVTRLGLRTTDIPYYETLLAVDSEESRRALVSLASETVINGVAGAVVNCIKIAIHAGGGVRPHVIVMDDLHWSDSATLELIAQVATLVGYEPLLLLAVLRPDRRAPSWQLVDRLGASLGDSFARIDLEPLDASASRELLGNLLQIEDLPERVRAQILERSEGNPFYLEEVLRSLIDGGEVVYENGHWRATKGIVDATIPETLAGVLSARIDRLPEQTKRVAQTASVIGRVFQHRVLQMVCGEGPIPERIEHVEPHIATLSYEQLVRERARDPEREYIFKHALTCEAAYGLLLKSRRRELHARAGQAIEALFPDRRDELAPMLAMHFTEADDIERGLLYAQRAAENARKLFASREELEHRDRVLALIDRLPTTTAGDKIDAIVQWAVVRHRVNRYDGVIPRLEEAISLARELGDKRRLAMALSWIGNIYMVTGFPGNSFPYITEAQALAEETGEESLMLLPLFAATWSLVDRDPAGAITSLDEVIRLAREQNAFDVQGHAMTYKGVALARLGRFEEARMEVEAALELAPHAGSPVKEADIHIGAGMAYYELGEVEKGITYSRIGAEGAFRVNGLQCACAGYFGVGRGEMEKRNFDAALGDLSKSLTLITDSPMEAYANQIKGSLALTQFELGTAASIADLRAAIQAAYDFGDEYTGVTLSQKLAQVLMRLGQFDEAVSLLEGAMQFYREREMLPYLQGALELMAMLEEKRGNTIAAAERRAEAASLIERINHATPLPVAAMAQVAASN